MHSIERQVSEFWPAVRRSDHRMLIGCSGGADSIALLRLMLQLRENPEQLWVYHFHHGLRETDADADEAFVREICRQHSLRLTTGRAPAGAIALHAGGEGMEAAARKARYDALIAHARKIGARYIALGHHADDQVETVLMNLVRGTGLAGIAGIPFVRTIGEEVSIVRPMLNVTRAEILAYLKHLKQSFRHDASNDGLDFCRNRVRHEVIPLLESTVHVGARASIRQLAQVVADAQTALNYIANSLLEACLIKRNASTCVLSFRQLDPSTPVHLRRELFVVLWRELEWPRQSMTFAHWQALAERTLTIKPGQLGAADFKSAEMLPGGVRVETLDNGNLRLSRLDDGEAD